LRRGAATLATGGDRTLQARTSPHLPSRSVAAPRDVGFELTFGECIGSPERIDIRNSRCLVLIGSHLGENTHNTQARELAEAIASDATIIVAEGLYDRSFGVMTSENWATGVSKFGGRNERLISGCLPASA
jgi:thiosulfate reductase/polysulfide reductase chain A